MPPTFSTKEIGYYELHIYVDLSPLNSTQNQARIPIDVLKDNQYCLKPQLTFWKPPATYLIDQYLSLNFCIIIQKNSTSLIIAYKLDLSILIISLIFWKIQVTKGNFSAEVQRLCCLYHPNAVQGFIQLFFKGKLKVK